MQIFSFSAIIAKKNQHKFNQFSKLLQICPKYLIRTQPKQTQIKKTKKTENKTRKLKLYVRTYPYPDFRANNAKINFREKEKKVLDQILGAGKYDARIRPSGINGTGEH